MLDEEVEASAAQRVADLAAAIGRQDDVRHVRGADRAELGDRHLEVGQDLEQERLESLVGPIDLVDQQHRRAVRSRDRAQQRTLEQVLPAENERLDVRGALPVVLGQPCAQHLPGIVPLVERRVDVEPFVALQANQLGLEQLRQHFRELGLSAAGFSFDQQRLAHLAGEEHGGRDGLVGHVAEALHGALQ